MATSNDVVALTNAYRSAQIRRATVIAALVAAYYRQKVAFNSPTSIQAWLDFVVPKIMAEHDRSAQLGATFGDTVRKIELPDLRDGFRFEPIKGAVVDQVKSSLLVVGPSAEVRQVAKIERMDLAPTVKQAMLEDIHKTAADKIAGSVVRHVQNGTRRTVEDNINRDRVALGYVRVTRDKPCFFCAMLASRGLEYNTYSKDSFAKSDPRFVGPGNAKVHDNCQCNLKPVYRADDEILAGNVRFEDMWYELSGEGDADPLTNFRRNYEGRGTTKAA